MSNFVDKIRSKYFPKMPPAFLKKSFKTVCVDTVLFFAMFALVGHITINYWERYTIQNELYSMKHSLFTLKDALRNIGKVYDSLHTELKDLLYEVNKKQTREKFNDTPECWQKEKLEAKCKAENKIDKKRRDFEIQTVLKTNKKKIGVGIETDKNPHGREHKASGPSCINASTNTRNPPKSTGTLSDISNKEDYVRGEKDIDNCRRHVCHGGGGGAMAVRLLERHKASCTPEKHRATS